MRFDQSLTAFALESSGAAARALGVSHTLTLAYPAEPRLVAAEVEFEGAAQRVSVPPEGPPPVTLTL